MNYPTFFIEPTTRIKVALRRYRSSENNKCTGPMGYHNADTPIGVIETVDCGNGVEHDLSVEKYKDDPRWPVKCVCGYVFTPDDAWQVFTDRIYRRQDNGEEMTLREAPAGAMWDAIWMRGSAQWEGPDGKVILVRMPGGDDWHVDGRASNCDSPCKNCGKPFHSHYQPPNNCKNYEDVRPHKCWVRTGTPPKLTVGKGAPGESCNAGAGSILVPGWHGFLRNGVLEQC